MLSKTQLSKMIQSGGFLGRLLGPLLKKGLLLIKNVIKSLTKGVLIPLGLTTTASGADAGIHKKILVSGHNHPSSSASHNTALIISNGEIGDIIKIVKSLEDSGLLVKGVTKTEQNEGFFSMLLGTLHASLLGNLLTGRGIYRAGKGKGKGINRAGERLLRAGYGRPSSSASQNNSNNKMDFQFRIIL